MLVAVAGGTGHLGGLIVKALKRQGAKVRALVRKESDRVEADEVVAVDFGNRDALANALRGVDVLVSALSGLRDVIVEAQTQLVDAAVEARVPRFIPSDFAIDYRKVPAGKNRNLDLRRDFRAVLETKRIRVTTIHNGAFMDMLLKQAPIVFPKIKKVLYWENANQKMAFTTMKDTATFTARAAMDPESPRDLHIAGDEVTARELAALANASLVKLGSQKRLEKLIEITRALTPNHGQLYPVWQGMQYLNNMFSGEGYAPATDRERYGAIEWTSTAQILKQIKSE